MGLMVRTLASDEVGARLEDGLAAERSSYAVQERRHGGSVYRLESRHPLRAAARRVMLTLSVAESEWERARETIMRTGGDDVEVLRVAPVPNTSRLRIHIGLESDTLDDTMRQIMRSLKAAEFGPVVAQHSESSNQSGAAAR
jgi:hypothetical protein